MAVYLQKDIFIKRTMMQILIMRSDYSTVQNWHCTFLEKNDKIKPERAT